jgi:hypothetical protein
MPGPFDLGAGLGCHGGPEGVHRTESRCRTNGSDSRLRTLPDKAIAGGAQQTILEGEVVVHEGRRDAGSLPDIGYGEVGNALLQNRHARRFDDSIFCLHNGFRVDWSINQ